MSNPGVITLAKINIQDVELRIEDNIGESIHVHFGNLRLDFSVNSFLKFAEMITQIAEKMINVNNFRYKDYDSIFLSQVSGLLLNLKKVEYVNVEIGDLMTDEVTQEGQRFISIKESRVSKALQGDESLIKNWNQTNHWGEDNISRYKTMYESIKERGYQPDKDTYITICDNGKFVQDGCHRVCSLYDLYGNIRVTVANWITNNGMCTDENRIQKFEREREEYLECQKQDVMFREMRKECRYWIAQYLIERDLKGRKIVFRGGGKHTLEMLKFMNDQEYQVVGIVAESVVEEELLAYPKLIMDDVKNMDVDVIVISSFRYREEMKADVLKYKTGMEVYDLYEHGLDCEFFS